MATLALPSIKRPSLALPTASGSGSASPAARRPSALAVAPAPKADRGESERVRARATVSPSPEAEAEAEDDADAEGEDDDEDAAKAKKGKKRKAAASAEGRTEYRYSSEIAQMMFVFGEVQDPLPETIRLVEDIVRGQVIEIVTRARLLTHLRSSRYLSAEDLIFLIRDDRGKVNRLRTYLSWKDVRKRAKEDEEGGDVDVDEADKNAAKGRKPVVKLPWELLTPFSDFLQTLPSQRADDDEDEDEDEMQAYQDSMQRLRDADEITKKMTKDEYVHYSDCRQASFTYRKARRFRDFINFGAYLDVRPNDDIIDILGFLAFEMVRSLCVTALDVRAQLARSAPAPRSDRDRATNGAAARQDAREAEPASPRGEGPAKRARLASPDAQAAAPAPTATTATATAPVTATATAAGRSLFAPPPSARPPLLPSHVLEAFAQIQRKEAAGRVGGMRSWRGGLTRGRVALI
ncbi:Transcription initiation protein spt3 [Cryptotrichosporon argae]